MNELNLNQESVRLTLRATFDQEQESIALKAESSDAFDDGDDTRAKIEVLAALAAKTNSIAAEIIRSYTEDDSQRKALYEHYTSLKEQMLEDMLEEVDRDSHE